MEEKKSYIIPINEAIDEMRKEGPIPFIWGGIKEGSFGYVFGPSKSGKTTFCENLAIVLVNGEKEFLSKPILEKEYRVLLLSFEEYLRPRAERNDKQTQFIKFQEDRSKDLLIINDNFPKYLHNDHDWLIFRDTIVDSGANVVIIDSLTRMSYGAIERSETARNISSTLKEIGRDCEITMIVIHHTPKLNGQMLNIDSLAGSHVFAQEADFLLGVNRVNGSRYIKEVACRYKREDDEKVLPFEINDHLWIVPGKPNEESALFKEADGRYDDKNRNAVRTLIKNNTESNESQSFKSKEILNQAEITMDRSTFFEKLAEMQASGEITKIRKGEYSFNNLPT